MPTAIRPRRSVLFMPGSNSRTLERAKTLPADALIFDLEDAVAPDAKAMARQMVSDAVRAGGLMGKRELIVRVNALGTPVGRCRPPPPSLTCGVGRLSLLPKGRKRRPRCGTSPELSLTVHGAPEQMAIWVHARDPTRHPATPRTSLPAHASLR